MGMFEGVRAGFRGTIRTLCRPTITGLDNVPTDGPFIIASNHLSFLDSVIIQAICPRPVAFFAKAEYFTTPGVKGRAMKAFFESVGSIPVERGEQAASVAALDALVDLLEDGQGVGIYPEGTRSRDGRLYRGRTGVGWLALSTGAMVQPVGLVGTDRVQPIGAKVPRIHRVRVRFGEPVDPKLYAGMPPGQARRQITDEVMD